MQEWLQWMKALRTDCVKIPATLTLNDSWVDWTWRKHCNSRVQYYKKAYWLNRIDEF